MKEIIINTLIDSIKLLPFLFITFLLMEYFEHRVSNKTKKTIEKSGKLGPLIGSFLGALPQCGFSVAATNLYATRIISLGTLIAIYLSTSDEMLPILISEKASLTTIITLIGVKVIVGIVFGFLIDFLLRKKEVEKIKVNSFCHDEHCDCEHSIIRSALKHTFNIIIFIILISFVLNIGFYYLGKESISKILMKNSIIEPFLASIIGLIPNCGASVVLTELYLNNAISFAAVISGLLTSSGVALLVLFRVNKNIKENIKIVLIMYIIGIVIGSFINLLGVLI